MMIDSELLKSNNQQKGMPTALLADVRPIIESSGTVHYTLTPTIIHQIFVEKPAVEKLYKENVPEKMSERDFWTKYFESLHFHRDNKKTTISTQADEQFAKLATEQNHDTGEDFSGHPLVLFVFTENVTCRYCGCSEETQIQ